MRIFYRPPLRLGDPDQAQHVDGLFPGLLAGHVAMQADSLGDLVADPHYGIERGHRLLEDHGDAIAPDRAHRGFIKAEQIGAFENQVFRLNFGHQPRCLGSRMSRSASPNRLVPNTTRLIATPGKITSHGATRTYSAADSDSMRPQDGYGSGMPSPRNDSEASVRMVEPSCAVASTISGASVLGSTWRSAIRVSLMPIDFAASTNGCSRSASVLARITRATVGISGIAIARITFGSDGPSAAVITSASTRSGRACRMSVTRWNRRSTQPDR